jgi:hypothetical protein
MAKYSKSSAIEAVITKAANTLIILESEYTKSLHVQTIHDSLLVEIKDYLGNLRSGLDYLNAMIPNSDRYFPICDDPRDFASRTAKVPPKVQAALAAWQPYNKQEWLRWFNILNNKNKHVGLTPQVRSAQVHTRVAQTGGGASVSWGSGVTFGPGVSILGVPINPQTQLPVANTVLKTERITWVNFYFDNCGEFAALPDALAVLPFLKDCFGKVCTIVRDLEDAL